MAKLGCSCLPCKTAVWEYQRAYRAANIDKMRAMQRDHKREWRKQHPGKANEIDRRWYQNNRELKLARVRAYGEANPNKLRALKLLRDWRVKNAPGFASSEQISARVAYYDDRCAYCGGEYEHLDHVIPVARGGTNWPANLRPACGACNMSKGAKPLSVFLLILKRAV